MSSVESGSTRVLKAFIAGTNATYREAGLSEYQLRVRTDGSVDAPNAPAAGQARAGARSASAAPAGTAAAGSAQTGAATTVAGAPPTLTKVDAPSTDSVRLTWEAVPGATRYGIWQDGQLIGSVPDPSFVAKIAANGSSTLEIDAELAGGRRSPKTPAVQVARTGEGPVQAQVAQAAQATPTPPASPGSQSAAADPA